MKKRTARILTGIAIVLVALGMTYAIWVGVSVARLRRAYAALERDGRPMRSEQVIPPAVEDTENAALLYESAALLLKAMPARWDDVPDEAALSPEEASARDKAKNLLGHLSYLSNAFLKESLAQDKRAKLELLLGEDIVSEALGIMRLGTERPSCRFDLDYEAGLNMILSPVVDVRDFLRILGAKARLEAEAGRAQNAWDLALTELRLADALRTEPTIISQVIRIFAVGNACQILQRVCAVAPPSRAQYETLTALLEGLDDITPIVASMDAERVLVGEWAFGQSKDELKQTIRQYVYEDEEYAPGILLWFRIQRICFKPALLADHAAYLRFMHGSTRLFKGPSSRSDFEALERLEWIGEQRHPLTGVLAPSMPRLVAMHGRMTAEIRITRAGLALLRYKQERGTWPETLGVLGLEGLKDPFIGGPLRYRSQGDGFVLYSVGDDEEDNGGAAKKPKQEKGFDIVWHFPGQTAG